MACESGPTSGVELTVRETGIVAILRGFGREASLETAAALLRGGVRAIEVTANTDGFQETLAAVSGSYGKDEVVIGAGTVLDSETAHTAVTAGADFLVTPTFDGGVVQVGARYGIPVVTGVMTPTEALTAFEAGATMCKLFPAASLGPAHVSALRGPLPQIPLVPTGGVNRTNASAFFEAGATALGIGSSIAPTGAVSDGDFETVENRAGAFVDIASRWRRE